MNFKGLLYEESEGIATITFNRPEASNGFTEWFGNEILNALTLAEESDAVRVVVIKGNGKLFSIGGDLVEMKRLAEEQDFPALHRIVEVVMKITIAIKHLPKPVIMSVNGAVAGAAFNLALAADICVASKDAKFIQAFVNVGLIPDAGGLFLLSRSVGMNKAMQLAMTGDFITAESAFEYGFVYRVCEADALERHTMRLAKRMAVGPKNSYAAMKQLMWKAYFNDFMEYAKLEVETQCALGNTEDFVEGVKAFAERRRPKFSGK